MIATSCFATLRLAADDLMPEVVTNIMNAKPEVSASKGMLLYPGSKSKAIAQTGTWFISTDQQEHQNAQDHLLRLFAILSPYASQIKEKYPNLDVRFSVFAEGNAEISESLARDIAQIGHLEITDHQAA